MEIDINFDEHKISNYVITLMTLLNLRIIGLH